MRTKAGDIFLKTIFIYRCFEQKKKKDVKRTEYFFVQMVMLLLHCSIKKSSKVHGKGIALDNV